MVDSQHSAQLTRALRGSFAKFSHVKLIHERMDQLREYECVNEEPESIAVIGDTGTGKSTLLKRYERSHPRVEHEELTEISVLYAEVPSRCTVKKLATILLRALGSKWSEVGDEESRTHQLVVLLKNCKVRLVILDEVNHLVDRGKERSHYAVADWIKQLISASRISFVLSGTPKVRTLLETNEQLNNRFGEVFQLKPFSASATAENSIAKAMTAFKKILGNFPTIPLSDPENLRLFAFATGGRLRSICKLLVRSVELACAEEKPKIDLVILAKAFSEVIYRDAPETRNPFLTKFDGTPLTKSGEPFFPSHAGR